jgi:DNA-directed RNA polymerase subunit K/omega
MPPKKSSKKDDKKSSKKTSKKSTKEKSKKSSKKLSKETTAKKKTDTSKKEVKKTKEKPVTKKKSESKPITKKKIQTKKEALSDDDSETSDKSSIKSEEESDISDSDDINMSLDDYENTETKMSEFFSDDNDSETNEDSEITDIKTETQDSSDPKEVIYNNFLSSQKVCNPCPPNKSKSIELKIVEKSKRMTNPRMTKYEMVRIIGERTKQFKMGAKPLIKNTDDLTYEEKALLELKKNMTPMKIKRPLPNNTVEIWDISELNKDHLEF